jgi:hypothetical protein
MSDNLMHPIINLNGTSPEALIDARLGALSAGRAMMNALGFIAPNGRDYIGRPDAYKRDLAIYSARRVAIATILDDLEQEALAIQDR